MIRVHTTSPARAPLAALLLTLAIGTPPAAAQIDPVGDPGPLFDSRDAWIAAAYLGGAALAFPFDERIAVTVRDSALQETPGLRPASRALDLLGVPGSLILSGGLYGVGRIGGIEEMADVGLHMGSAIVVAEAVTYTLKFLVGRARPVLDIHDPFDFKLGRGFAREDHHRSFPSGHTSAAFAVASVAAHEIERIWGGNDYLIGLATYGPAALVGVSRMFGNRHWTSDVVFGAAIGAFSGWKIVRYTHAHPDNRLDDWFLAGSIAPWDLSTLRLTVMPVGR